jgi:hypothetical protein
MRGQIVRSLILGSVAALLLAVGPVTAKIPYFSIEVSPTDPVDGDAVVIVVRMWDDPAHSQPATWSPGPTVDGLLEVQGAGGRVPVTLVQLDKVTYRAEVTLSAGTWQIVPFPDLNGGVGAPHPRPTITVGVPVAGSPSSAAPGIAAGGALGVVAVALLFGWPLRRRMKRGKTVAR